MIFLPREGDVEKMMEFGKPEEELITLDTIQLPPNAYEVTSPSATEFSDYRSIAEQLTPVLKADDRCYIAVEWVKKKNCLVLVTDNIDEKVKSLADKGISVSYEAIEYQLWEESHQFITDRSEYEGIADLVVECVKDDDRYYLAFDWKKKRNVFLWSTKAPDDRARCIREKGVAAVVRG